MEYFRMNIPCNSRGEFWLLFLLMFFFISCSSCRQPRERNAPSGQTSDKENLIRNQQEIVRDESAEIDRYLERRGLEMNRTLTGLRYVILSRGSHSNRVNDDCIVTLDYKVSLLDGKTIYNSDDAGPMELKVGKSEIATGLQEGLKYLCEGDVAKFIIPSHLAYGLTGDGDLIKHYQVIVVDVKLLNVACGVN